MQSGRMCIGFKVSNLLFDMARDHILAEDRLEERFECIVAYVLYHVAKNLTCYLRNFVLVINGTMFTCLVVHI